MSPEIWNRIYCGPAPDPADLWTGWNVDPVLLLALAVLALAMRRSRPGLLGTAVLAVAFVSPLCALSAALFSARVVHHVLLIAVAAPLLASAWPARRSGAGTAAIVVSTAVLWAWHWPGAYDLALSWVPAYWVMQLSLLAAFVALWRIALHARQPAGHALSLVFAAWMQMALLGALLTFAPDPLYAAHLVAPLAWGLDALRDQQLGGLIMWVPAGLPFLVLGGMLARRGWRGLAERAA